MKQLIKTSLGAALLALSLPGMAQIVVVMNPKAPETALSKDQISQFFLGKSNAMTPVDQMETGIRSEFYKKVTDRDISQVKTLWSKLVFTGRATMPREAVDGAAVKKLVANDPSAIGYIDRSMVDSSVKVVYAAQ